MIPLLANAARAAPASAAGRTTTAHLPWPVWVLPILAALATFVGTLGGDFVYDDRMVLERLPVLSHLPLTDLLASGRSLTWLVHWIDWRVWGEWAPGFHATNILLHAGASAALAVLAARLARSAWVGALTGLLFAVHPVHVEAVASFANRKDVLATLCVALALLLWSRPERRRRHELAALALYVLALYAKEVTAVGLAGLFVLHDVVLLRTGARRALAAAWPALALAGIATTGFLWVHDLEPTLTELRHSSNGAIATRAQVSFTALSTVHEALRLLVWPHPLSPVHVPTPQTDPLAPAVVTGAMLLTAITAAAVWMAPRRPVASFALGFVLLAWLPSSNLVPLDQHFVQERYLYLAAFAPCLLVALALGRLLESGAAPTARRAAWAAAILLVLVGGSVAARASTAWRDDTTLWRSSLAAGESFAARSALGRAALERGDGAAAVRHYRRCVAMHPCPRFRARLAAALALAGAPDRAARQCRLALSQNPRQADAARLLASLTAPAADPSVSATPP